MEGLPRKSETQRQPPHELWRNFPKEQTRPPSWVESTQVSQWAMKKKKNFPSGPHITKEFLIGHNHRHASQQVPIPSKLYAKKTPPWVIETSQQIILPSESFIIPSGFFTRDSLMGQNTKATRAYILWELNMQAWATHQSSKVRV